MRDLLTLLKEWILAELRLAESRYAGVDRFSPKDQGHWVYASLVAVILIVTGKPLTCAPAIKTKEDQRSTLAVPVLASHSVGEREARSSTAAGPSSTPTFYRDVLPILQEHCQSCHHPDAVAPMPFMTYDQTRPWAYAIREDVLSKKMPPWFADPQYGHFSNDPSLTPEQIATLSCWADAKAPAGHRHDAAPPHHWAEGWSIPPPDRVVQMPKPVALPARGDVEYTYEIVPTNFTQDKWVQVSEVRPSSREHVHHAVAYIRPPDSPWLRHAPIGTPFTASTLTDEQDRRGAHWTDSDILLVYAPGSSPDLWPDEMAKFVPAGSDLVFQMHYTTNGRPGSDQTSIGLVFAKQPPKLRVLTLQLTNDHFVIPPGVDDYRVEVHGTLPNDATLLSFLPHMHLRGKRFEYNIIRLDGSVETLLRVNYHFHWQLSYRLAEPRLLKAGTKLQAVAWYDNSRNNPHNPDPESAVRWGEQTYDEMMVGFFDVAVPASVDKWHYFIRPNGGRGPGNRAGEHQESAGISRCVAHLNTGRPRDAQWGRSLRSPKRDLREVAVLARKPDGGVG